MTLLEKPDAALYAEAIRETIAEADQLLVTFNALLSIAEAEAGSRRDTATVIDLEMCIRDRNYLEKSGRLIRLDRGRYFVRDWGAGDAAGEDLEGDGVLADRVR